VRYAIDHKEETHRIIVKLASSRFRRDGLAAVGLRPLMADAGLTHGGFYAHFSSREELVAEAIGEALRETLNSLSEAVAEVPEGEGLEAFINAYLNSLHRDRPDRGCAGAALVEEMAREPAEVRRPFTEGIEAIVSVLADQLPPGGSEAERMNRAFGVFSLLMGALQLSRSVDDAGKSSAILQSGRLEALSLARLRWS